MCIDDLARCNQIFFLQFCDTQKVSVLFPNFAKLSELTILKEKFPKISNFLVKKVMNFIRKNLGAMLWCLCCQS